MLASCSDEKDDFVPVYNVPEEYQPLIDAFIEEAFLRGLTITLENLIIKHDNELESAFCGTCNSNELKARFQKIIRFNPENQCWINPQQKEALVFHELGHCILGRLHINKKLPNGDAKSMMTPNDISVYSPCVYQLDGEVEDCNNVFKRDYYLDELFDATTPIPEWSK